VKKGEVLASFCALSRPSMCEFSLSQQPCLFVTTAISGNAGKDNRFTSHGVPSNREGCHMHSKDLAERLTL